MAVPDKIESSIGTLDLPTATLRPILSALPDNLDRSRALQAQSHGYPDCESGWHARLDRSIWAGQPDRCDLGKPRRSAPSELTANDSTVYNFIWVDTKKGPLVVEVPPEVLGGVNDFWYRWVADVGITGEDKGKKAESISFCLPITKVTFRRATSSCAPQHLRQLAFLPRCREWFH